MLSNITNYTINNSLETGKNMLKELGDRAINSSNNLTDAMSKNVQSSLESLWNNWIGNHPLIGFFCFSSSYFYYCHDNFSFNYLGSNSDDSLIISATVVICV